MTNFIDAMLANVKKAGKTGVVTTVQELRENQYGLPLQHYAQQYLFGATGLRLQVFNSIAGFNGTCKSTILFDLMGSVCASKEDGGLGGIGFLYEMEQKISPTVLYSILKQHGESARNACVLMQNHTLETAMSDLNTNVIKQYLKLCPRRDAPLIVGLDSIGGAASADTVGKLEKEGYAGKGYYDKAHLMKHFCENEGAIFMKNNIPIVVICINQEKESQGANAFAPPQKKVTGGTSQTFKEGHMISASKKVLASGDGNLIYLRTTKTSFCDPRKIEVEYRWNKFGKDADDYYNAYLDWPLASARCLAEPEKGVGDIRDICDVKVSDQKLVTCPQLGLKSVRPAEFEAALMANEEVLGQLYTFQKIERLKDNEAFAESLRASHKDAPEEPPAEEPRKVPARKSRSRSAKPAPAPEPAAAEEEA